MATNRLTIKSGPAKITYKGITIHARGDVKLDCDTETFDVESQTLATPDARVNYRKFMLDFNPDGRVTFDAGSPGDILAVLYECQSLLLGQSIFGTEDYPVVVHWKNDGDKMTFPAGGISKPPDLLFSGKAPLFSGACQFSLIGKNNTATTDAAKYFTLANSAYTEDAAYGSIITESPTVAWGAVSPWDAINTQDGVKVAFALDLDTQEDDVQGPYDMRFKGLKITAQLTPTGGITPTQLLTAAALQGAGARRGAALNAASLGSLDVSNSVAFLRIYGAALTKSPLTATKSSNRIGELTFVNTLDDDPDAVFFIGSEEPA